MSRWMINRNTNPVVHLRNDACEELGCDPVQRRPETKDPECMSCGERLGDTLVEIERPNGELVEIHQCKTVEADRIRLDSTTPDRDPAER